MIWLPSTATRSTSSSSWIQREHSLLQQLADEKGLKLSALARDAIYDWVGSHTESTVFEAAEALDHAQWRESVQKRLDGRKRNREMRLSAREVS